ncbi:ABC transporter A family member 1-like isoform X2 [Quercus suber]|uniref:ABC transporter A family member 1-like isoform X2 n=1 Tax=Quercus suber TaxID=58331 RepID=UPI0032DE8505
MPLHGVLFLEELVSRRPFIICQLQQVLDAFIMISGQRTYSTSQIIEIPSVQSSDNASLLMLPLMQFSPSNIRIAPFLTPKYTDDEFWCLLGFPYPISCLISFSVFKKE